MHFKLFDLFKLVELLFICSIKIFFFISRRSCGYTIEFIRYTFHVAALRRK